MELEKLRHEYLRGGLNEDALQADPVKQFETWMNQAIELQIYDPTAMVMATVSENGQPSQRMVLLKHFDHKGFVFFTNYGSRKAREIASNAKVSLLFPWNDIDRQVKIRGQAEKIPTAESLKYFVTRPLESQLAAWGSKQSQPLSSKQALLTQIEQLKQKFVKGEIPLPDFWVVSESSRPMLNSGRVENTVCMTVLNIASRRMGAGLFKDLPLDKIRATHTKAIKAA